MLINFRMPLYDIDEKPILNTAKEERDDNGKVTKPAPVLTLGDICITSLMNAQKNEKGEDFKDGAAKLHFFILGASIRDAMKPDKEPIKVTAEDIVLLKALIANNYIPLVAGQAWLMLDSE